MLVVDQFTTVARETSSHALTIAGPTHLGTTRPKACATSAGTRTRLWMAAPRGRHRVLACRAPTRRLVEEQVARLAFECLAELGQRAEPDGPGAAILQYGQVHDRDADPLRQLRQRHLAQR